MPDRVFLRRVKNQLEAEMYVAHLDAVGFKAVVVQPLFPNLSAPTEVWLVDGRQLEEPGAQEIIDEIFSPENVHGITEEEVEEAANPTKATWFRWWHFAVALALGISIWIFGFGRPSFPNHKFMKAGKEQALHPEQAAWNDEAHMFGREYALDQPQEETLGLARAELRPKGFTELVYFETPWLMLAEGTDPENGYREMIGIAPGLVNERDQPTTLEDPSKTTILWLYRPSTAQILYRMLGLK